MESDFANAASTCVFQADQEACKESAESVMRRTFQEGEEAGGKCEAKNPGGQGNRVGRRAKCKTHHQYRLGGETTIFRPPCFAASHLSDFTLNFKLILPRLSAKRFQASSQRRKSCPSPGDANTPSAGIANGGLSS